MTERELNAIAKENYLNALDHKPTYWQPVEGENLVYAGFEACNMEKGPRGGGYDGFGVRWVAPNSGGGTVLPAPNEFVLKDIDEWRSITIPSVEEHDWSLELAALNGVDRATNAIDYASGNGHFERLAALMGFENALISMAMNPDAVNELFERITRFKIDVVHKVKKLFDPDTFTLYDDVATQSSPFMSPTVYRELIAPHHKRVAEACLEEGIRPILHCCGYAEPLVDSFVKEGFVAWSSVQPSNNILGILKQYGNRFCISGGYDTNGVPGSTCDEDIIRQEVLRCYDTYGGLPGYIFAGFALQPPEEGVDIGNVWAPTSIIFENAIPLGHERAGISGQTKVTEFSTEFWFGE